MCFKDPSHSRKSKLYYLPHFWGNFHAIRWNTITFGRQYTWLGKQAASVISLHSSSWDNHNTVSIRGGQSNPQYWLSQNQLCNGLQILYLQTEINFSFFFFSVCIATWRGIYIVCLWYIHETEESIVYLCWISLEHGISRLWLQMIKRITFYTWGSDIVTFLSCTCTVVLGDTLHLV